MIGKTLINQKAAQAWLPAVEESDLPLTSPVFPDSKKPVPSRAGPREPHFPMKIWESCIVLRLYRERGDVTALCSNVPSPISQYLLMPKRRTP